MEAMTEHLFDADTAVHPDGDHYAATLTDRWTALGGTPNGGYMLAVALRALKAETPFPDPLVTSAHFLRPGLVGPAEITTEVVRAGRRVATGEARLIQDGREIVRLLSTFGDLDQAEGRTLVLGEAPRLPSPDETPDVLDGNALPGVSITEQLEYRAPEPPGWAKGAPDGEPSLEFWMRFRAGRRRRARGARHRRARIGHDGADRARARPAGAGLARVPHDDAPRDRRFPRGGLRDLGLGRQPRRPVAAIRAASGIAPNRFPQHAGSPVDRASPGGFHRPWCTSRGRSTRAPPTVATAGAGPDATARTGCRPPCSPWS
jgi:hypothetical protein